jgi:hypothetical protein
MKKIRLPFGIVSLALCFFIAPLVANAKEVRLEDFGAVVNDGLDDSAALQAAADDILELGGGTILFPSGKIDIRRTVSFLPDGYVGADIKLKGNRGSIVEISAGVDAIPFYGGNLNTWTFEDLIIIGKNVPPADPAFYDAGWVIYSTYVNHTNIIRCQFFGLAVPNNRAVVHFGNTDGRIVDSQFDGNLGQYPNGAVIMAEDSRGLTVTRATFIDFANFAGTYLSKSPEYTGAWIWVKGGRPLTTANGQRRFVVEDSRFDEAAAAAVRVEDATWANIRGISVNVNGADPGTGVYLKNVEHATLEQSWFGYTQMPRPAVFTDNVQMLEVNSLKFGGGVYFIKKNGAGAMDVRDCKECVISGKKR